MKVRNVWNIKQLPLHYVAELPDGKLKLFYVSPFKEITPDDLTGYEGHHPRKCNGVPMPDYLHRFYGIERVKDSGFTEKIIVRVSPEQKSRVDAKGAPSDVIRKLIDEMDDEK